MDRTSGCLSYLIFQCILAAAAATWAWAFVDCEPKEAVKTGIWFSLIVTVGLPLVVLLVSAIINFLNDNN